MPNYFCNALTILRFSILHIAARLLSFVEFFATKNSKSLDSGVGII